MTSVDDLRRALAAADELAVGEAVDAYGALSDAVHAFLDAQQPQPYRCTVLVEMPADDGQATRPEDVVATLQEMGVQVLAWHDEQLIDHDDDAS